MTREDQLVMLKHDLERSQTFVGQDEYLLNLLEVAAEKIAEEGIVLTDSIRDGMLCVSYAAYLYRKRAAPETAMPRMLRWDLNQRLFKQKGAEDVT